MQLLVLPPTWLRRQHREPPALASRDGEGWPGFSPNAELFATDVNLGAGLVTTGKGVQAINSSRLGSIRFMWAES